MKVILIVGGWGSGTTALAGSLCHLGVPGFGPFWKTDDPRTPNTYEMVPFRNLLLRYIDERAVFLPQYLNDNLLTDLFEFRDQLEGCRYGDWQEGVEKRVMLKHPLAALCLPQLCEVFDIDILVSLRRFRDIEATRQRRGWHESYGKKGAQIIYSKVFSEMLRLQKSYLAVGYSEFTSNSDKSLQKIVDYCGLQDLTENVAKGAEFVRADT